MDEGSVLVILKVSTMIIYFLIVIVVGTIPIRSKSFKQKPLLRAIGSTFAGALFINVAIVHILPQSADTLEQAMKDGREDVQVFPVANLLMMVGFLITLFFTKVFSNHRDMHDDTSQKDKLNEQPFTEQQNKNKNKDVYILTLAMYFHTIFEGIAVGVQNSIGGFLSIAVAIGLHKWADALSMGCHYRSKNLDQKKAYILIIGQAVLNVLAIGTGWLIASQGLVVEAIFLSISAGTFLAISTLQLLSQQFHTRKYIIMKYLLLVLATGFVSCIWFFENSIFSQ